ncbi:hypothetical protein PROFUN_13350 [Planoprotostelium fungivorum]|uniref:Translocation protein SEC62 n=1 Tax=Planoprotostelium fungivorum TaxID=1890364 RepID=A0A2P6N450_9EUKA|nr:hypothetical protein PROFUN_13350 [Planoprotostelium fungivorum]
MKKSRLDAIAQRQASAPPDMVAVTEWLKSKSKMRVHIGLWAGKKVEYFKGRAAIKALQSPEYAKVKGVPAVTDEASAIQVLNDVLSHDFYKQVYRTTTKTPKALAVSDDFGSAMNKDGYYMWFYEGSQMWTYVGGFALVLAILAGVMYPVWPQQLKGYAWYVSIAGLILIGAYFALGGVRLVIWAVTRIMYPYGLWIFPQMFADVGIVETFQPLYEWDSADSGKKKKKKKKEEKEEEKEKESKKERRARKQAAAETVETVEETKSE